MSVRKGKKGRGAEGKKESELARCRSLINVSPCLSDLRGSSFQPSEKRTIEREDSIYRSAVLAKVSNVIRGSARERKRELSAAEFAML